MGGNAPAPPQTNAAIRQSGRSTHPPCLRSNSPGAISAETGLLIISIIIDDYSILSSNLFVIRLSHKSLPPSRIFQKSCSQIHRIHKTGASLATRTRLASAMVKCAFFPHKTIKLAMKNLFSDTAVRPRHQPVRRAQDHPSGADTNAPAEKNEVATIPGRHAQTGLHHQHRCHRWPAGHLCGRDGHVAVLAHRLGARIGLLCRLHPPGETNKAARPVTFCFNGGPGSSSVWLHSARSGRAA